MTSQSTPAPNPSKWLRIAAVVGIVFGAMTVFSGGSVLFGPPEARIAAGSYVPYVVWFNFLAGFAYIAAGIGIWLGTAWANGLSVLIVTATGLVAVVFGIHVATGGAFEMRTVGALVFRIAIWAGIIMALRRTGR